MSSRVPPYNNEAECAVLGSMLINPLCIPKTQKILIPKDFYREAHQNISQAIFELKNKTDLVTISEFLNKKNLLERCGGNDYLASLVADIMTSAGIEYHAQIIKNLSKRRQIISHCSIAAERAFGLFDDIDDILSEHKAGVRSIENDQQNTITSNKNLLMTIMDDLEKGADDHTVGVLTGLKNIDDNLSGLEPKTTYYIIAESGMAKSALALNIASNIALKYPGKVPYFTLESTGMALTRRRLAKHSHVALTRLRNRNIRGEWEWENITKACNTLSEPNLMLIDSTHYQTIENLTAFCESLVMDEKISLIIIDYIQLLESIKHFNSRHLEISYISKQLNFLAKDLNIPILIISQLGKDVEKRNKKEPMLSDIKESGDIRNNADNILSIYTPKPEDVQFYTKIRALKGKDTGRWTTWLHFDGNFQEFVDCEDQFDDPIQKDFSY